MIGAVLAGGSGRRFGGDKLLYRVNGKPLILYTLERLETAKKVDEVVLIASRDNVGRLEKLGYHVVVDELLIGPMGGVYTALSLGDAFVVAGDMPRLVSEFVDYIIEEFRKSGKMVCVPRWENGYLEPLHSAYSSAFREILEEKIRAGSYALNRAIRSANSCYLQIESLPEGWRESFFNVNTREDLERIRGIRETTL